MSADPKISNAPGVRPATARTGAPAPARAPAVKGPAPLTAPVPITPKALRAAIAKSNAELHEGPAVVGGYGAERRRAGSAGLWDEVDVTARVRMRERQGG